MADQESIPGGAAPVTDNMVRFNAVGLRGREFDYLQQALSNGHLSGNGDFTKRCQALLEHLLEAPRALLTHSATAALEMSAILAGIKPGDEVILPSFTFVSTANAVVLRGGIPVFADIRPDTLNIDETCLEELLTPRTKALMVVHYAGVGCAMEAITAFCTRHGLMLIEDAAQAMGASYRGRPLGGFGQLSCFSFHETKNIVSGEGGALCINDPSLVARAEIIWEKGTDRASFYRGEVDKYTWQDIGSSFLPSELVAAFLLAQLEDRDAVTDYRRNLWNTYHELVKPLERRGLLTRPVPPGECQHNGHLYWIALEKNRNRGDILAAMRSRNVFPASHYVPLHSSPAGRTLGRTPFPLPVTEDMSARLLRLPMHGGLSQDDVEQVVDALQEALG